MGGTATETDQRTCNSGPACKDHNGRTAHPTEHPLCPACLDAADHDIRALVYDYLDLAQLHETSLSQAINEKTTGSLLESPMLLSGHVEALQAEIVHATAMWEYELRVAGRLSDPNTYAPLWRTTVYDHIDLIRHGARTIKARGGASVQRAVGIILPRLARLAALPETLVCPTGVEDEPQPMAGWQAIHQLQQLHGRARSTLGRTVRRFWIPGECWTCNAKPKLGEDGPLYRSEPRFPEDPMQVNCDRCGAYRAYADYEQFQANLQWPGQDTDLLVRVAP
jgi:hypothetical protein